mgnify:CR=1 FL=1
MTHLASHTEVCHILNPSCILAQSLVLPITITVLYSVQYITTITYNLSRVVPPIRLLTPKNRKIMRFSRVWSSKLCFSICSDHCSTVFGLIFVWGKLNSANSMVGWIIGNIWPDSVVPSPVTHPNRPVSLITGDNYWKLYQDVYLDWFVFRVFDDATVTTLEDQSLDALSTAAPSRSDAFGDCFQAIQEYSNYVELFLIKENECFIAEDVTFM